MTTIVGIKIKSLVIIGADQKVSCGHLAVTHSNKLIQFSPRVWGASTGSVGSIQRMGKKATRSILINKILNDNYTFDFSPSEFCNQLAEMSFDIGIEYPFASMVNQFGFIVGGLSDEGEPMLMVVEDDGSIIESEDILCHGSGRELALSTLRGGYQPDMTKDEAMQLIVRAIAIATASDNYSGGNCDFVTIEKDGITLGHSDLSKPQPPEEPKPKEAKAEKKK